MCSHLSAVLGAGRQPCPGFSGFTVPLSYLACQPFSHPSDGQHYCSTLWNPVLGMVYTKWLLDWGSHALDPVSPVDLDPYELVTFFLPSLRRKNYKAVACVPTQRNWSGNSHAEQTISSKYCLMAAWLIQMYRMVSASESLGLWSQLRRSRWGDPMKI